MRSIIIYTTFCFFLISNLSAQSKENITYAKKGDIDAAFGIGLLPTFAADDARLLVPPVSASIAFRIKENLSVGPYIAYSSSKISEVHPPSGGDIYTWQNDFLVIGLRGLAHFCKQDNWDLYGGFLLGMNMPNVTRTIGSEVVNEKDLEGTPSYHRPARNNFAFSGLVGARYYPTKDFGFYGELGFGISIITIGVTYKI